MQAKDAETLEQIALGAEAGLSPAHSASALRDIAQRIRAAAPAATAVQDAPAPTSADEPDAQLAAMVGSCEECRAAATGQPPTHDTDMLRHAGHAEQLAQLIARVANAAASAASDV
ncbi:MAG TPA: hypothetical protein VNF28_01985 [Candidatus Binataceae bacterium]|nr:hypothetical protein [Candidatus Binataceae bacterium]